MQQQSSAANLYDVDPGQISAARRDRLEKGGKWKVVNESQERRASGLITIRRAGNNNSPPPPSLQNKENSIWSRERERESKRLWTAVSSDVR